MEAYNLSSSCDRSFIAAVSEESGQDVRSCYACGNCTAGCPVTPFYDLPVHQIMRLLQAGQREKILGSSAIWLCASCETCTTRCPNNIDVARIMDTLRHMARREGYGAEKRVRAFTDAFLDSVAKHGRIHELGLLIKYKAATGRFLDDAALGPKLLAKGKMAFLPHSMVGKDKVAAIFRRFAEASAKGASR
jgi:heterodisulfide reductase subunit C